MTDVLAKDLKWVGEPPMPKQGTIERKVAEKLVKSGFASNLDFEIHEDDFKQALDNLESSNYLVDFEEFQKENRLVKQ